MPEQQSSSPAVEEEVAVAPRDVVILQDHLGLPERIRAMRDAHPEVYAVAPAGKPAIHCQTFEPPLEWMTERDIPLDRKCWLKADAMGLAAALQCAPAADFYWFIETDVVASQVRWKALFHEFRNNRADGLATTIGYRGDDPRMERFFEEAPEGANRFFVMALYRLSRRAVEASIEEAPALRECFSEISVPWVLQKHGLGLKRINGASVHFNATTFRPKPPIRIDRDLICHPVKTNTYGP